MAPAEEVVPEEVVDPNEEDFFNELLEDDPDLEDELNELLNEISTPDPPAEPTSEEEPTTTDEPPLAED